MPEPESEAVAASVTVPRRFAPGSGRVALGAVLSTRRPVTALEVVLIFWGHHPGLALWVGDLIPALVAGYFVQQLFINMGD